MANLQWVESLEDIAVNAPSASMPPARPAARSFRDLVVWRQAHAFVLAVYRFTAIFPKQETYGLSLQMRRAAISIAANVAEGFAKRTKPEKARYLNIAEGSVEESRYYLILAHDLGLWGYPAAGKLARRSQPPSQRVCASHSGFSLLTSGFHIPAGYQGRSPWLASCR